MLTPTKVLIHKMNYFRFSWIKRQPIDPTILHNDPADKSEILLEIAIDDLKRLVSSANPDSFEFNGNSKISFMNIKKSNGDNTPLAERLYPNQQDDCFYN